MRLREFAPAGGGGSGNYFQALASAWYNGVFDTGSLQKGIKSQEDVERLLNRGIVCPDGKTRKLHIDYNSDFDGVEIYSDDYYEYGDHDDTIDSRTGKPWGPYDFMAFSDEDLSEGLNEFAADDGNDGGEDDALRNYARMWWAGDEATQMQIERALAKMGWEIGEDEGGYDNGGVFVVRAGDENGNSYQSWAAEDLTEGLTEVDRRGFLKGLGAAAVVGAGLGASKSAMSEEDYGRIVYNMLWLYEICKGDNWSSNGPSRNFCPHVKQSVQKFSASNNMGPMGKSSGKMILNSWYKKVISDYQSYEQNAPQETGNPDLDKKIAVGKIRRMYVVAAPEIIQAFDSLMEFNESVNQGVAEGSDPWGSQGRFVGDTGPTQVSTTVPRVQLRIGDRVLYKPTEQRARIEALSKDGTKARIHISSPMGGRIFNCRAADLKALGELKEKSTSQAQFRTMAAAAHDPKFARKVGIKQSVAREFNKADKGQSYKSLPKRAD